MTNVFYHDWRTQGYDGWVDAAWTGGGCNLGLSSGDGLIATCGTPWSQGAVLDTNGLGISGPFQLFVETNSSAFTLCQGDAPPNFDGSNFGTPVTSSPNTWVTITKRYLHLAGPAHLFKFQRFGWSTLAEPGSEGDIDCQFGFATSDLVTSNNPVSLRFGEKRLRITDLSLTTSSENFSFIRSYNQFTQHLLSNSVCGLGWSHNHRVFLETMGNAPTRVVRVHLPEGGTLLFDESGSNTFTPRSGATSHLQFNTVSSEFFLTNQDRSVYSFDPSTYQLKSIQSSTGDVWTYTYSSSRLTQVDDGYARRFELVYINNPSSFDDGQLWRVGDQTASGLSTSTPSGRFVEYTYTPEKKAGVAVVNPRPLLLSVKDVRGFTWQYSYYGQLTGENDDSHLNLLIARRTPLNSTIEALSYQFAAPVQRAINGDMELDSSWTNISGAAPTTNQRSTTQVYSGTYSRYVEMNAAGQGIEGTAFNLVAGRRYMIMAQVYVVSGTAKMGLSGTSQFDSETVTSGTWQLLTSTYIPRSSIVAERLQFTAKTGAAAFFVDAVSIRKYA